jgi:hypothetical protein
MPMRDDHLTSHHSSTHISSIFNKIVVVGAVGILVDGGLGARIFKELLETGVGL